MFLSELPDQGNLSATVTHINQNVTKHNERYSLYADVTEIPLPPCVFRMIS